MKSIWIHLLLLPLTVAFILPSGCFAEEHDPASPQAIISGEVENPGRFELTKAATLGAIFSEVTKTFAMGSTRRIQIYRNGRLRLLDLKKFGDFALIDGDIVEVPIKYVYDEQPGDRVVRLFSEDSKTFLGQVVTLKNDLWKAQTNWREGIEGIEFRPTGKTGTQGGISVFVRAATTDEIKTIKGQQGKPEPKSSNALLAICRDPGRGENPSEFELTLVAQIRAIPSQEASQQNQPGESGPRD